MAEPQATEPTAAGIRSVGPQNPALPTVLSPSPPAAAGTVRCHPLLRPGGPSLPFG